MVTGFIWARAVLLFIHWEELIFSHTPDFLSFGFTQNEVICGEQEKESIFRVRMG